MTDKEKIKNLEAELAIYKDDIAAQFYKSLANAIKHINHQIETKKLNLEEDIFAKSIITLADKSAKIFEGLKNGKAAFALETEEKQTKKTAKSETAAI